MLHHEFRIPIRNASEGADIFFAGDEQEGSEGYREDAWQAFKEDWKRSPNPWLIHMGDARDWLRPSMRERINATAAKDPSMKRQLDDLVLGGLEKTLQRLEFMKGRIIGMHEGHHDWEFTSGANATMLMAEGLKTINMGWVATTRITIEIPRNNPTPKDGGGYTFTIASSHGNASGRTTTSVAQSMEQSLKDFVCDLKVEGHACRSAAWIPHEYKLIRRSGPAGIIRVVPRHLLVGGFCDAYTDGWISRPREANGRKTGGRPGRSYAEGRNMVAQPLMWGVARIRLRRNADDARAAGINKQSYLPDIETVNRGPAIDENGLYR